MQKITSTLLNNIYPAYDGYPYINIDDGMHTFYGDLVSLVYQFVSCALGCVVRLLAGDKLIANASHSLKVFGCSRDITNFVTYS